MLSGHKPMKILYSSKEREFASMTPGSEVENRTKKPRVVDGVIAGIMTGT